MSLNVSPQSLVESLRRPHPPLVIDVRKVPAFTACGLIIPGARRRLPEQAGIWWSEFGARSVVVYCVHGHEVSQNVSRLLRSHAVDAAYLQGGFEGWRAIGGEVVPFDDRKGEK